jgi:hypothetical protein
MAISGARLGDGRRRKDEARRGSRGRARYIGARQAQFVARTPRQGPGGGTGFLAVLAMAASQMGCTGPALAETDAGQGGAGSGLWARPSKERFIIFFRNKFSMRKQFQEKSRSCLKARKILRKSQKFQENSQK